MYNDPTGQLWNPFNSINAPWFVSVGNAANTYAQYDPVFNYATNHVGVAYAVGGVGIAAGGAAGVLYGLGAAGISTLGGTCVAFCNQATQVTNEVSQVAPRLTNFGDLQVVSSAQQKLDSLSQKFGLSTNDILNQASNSTQKFVDNGNSGNINTWIARPDGGEGFIRITTNPEMTRVISAGLNTVENVKNGIANGRFTPLK